MGTRTECFHRDHRPKDSKPSAYLYRSEGEPDRLAYPVGYEELWDLDTESNKWEVSTRWYLCQEHYEREVAAVARPNLSDAYQRYYLTWLGTADHPLFVGSKPLPDVQRRVRRHL